MKTSLSTRIVENRVHFDNSIFAISQLQEKEVARVDDLMSTMKVVQEQLQIAFKRASNSELISKQNEKEVQRFEQTKFSIAEQTTYAEKTRQTLDHLTNKIDDVFNRGVKTDIYLDKYLPYNNFVQFIEILHVALEKQHLEKIEDYENAKLQNYLAEILLDMGRHKNANGQTFDHKKVLVPHSDKEKPVDCECGQSDFKAVLFKQVKLSSRNAKVLRKIQDRRQMIFQDKLVYNP